MLLSLLRIDWQNPLAAALVAASTITANLIDVDTESAALASQSLITANLNENVTLSSSLSTINSISPLLTISHFLSSNLINTPSASAILIDQDTLFSPLSAQSILSSGLQLQKTLSSATIVVPSLAGQIGASVSASLKILPSSDGTIFQVIGLDVTLNNRITLNSQLLSVWNLETHSQTWINQPHYNKATPPYGLLSFNWFTPFDAWSKKIVGEETWNKNPLINDPWSMKLYEIDTPPPGLLGLSWGKTSSKTNVDPWIKKHG